MAPRWSMLAIQPAGDKDTIHVSGLTRLVMCGCVGVGVGVGVVKVEWEDELPLNQLAIRIPFM